MLVEIIGPPGSGKSTLVARMRGRGYRNLQDLAMAVIRAEYGRLWSSVQSLGAHIPLLRRAFLPDPVVHRWASGLLERGRIGEAYQQALPLLAQAAQDPRDVARLQHRLSLHNAHGQALERGGSQAALSVIADEFWLQTLLSLGPIRSGEADLVPYRSLMDAAPVPDLLVVLTTPPQRCWQQMTERRRGPPAIWNGLDQARILTRLAACQESAQTIAQHFQNRGAKVLHADLAMAEAHLLQHRSR